MGTTGLHTALNASILPIRIIESPSSEREGPTHGHVSTFLEYGAYPMQAGGGAALNGPLLDRYYDIAVFLADKGARIKERDWR